MTLFSTQATATIPLEQTHDLTNIDQNVPETQPVYSCILIPQVSGIADRLGTVVVCRLWWATGGSVAGNQWLLALEGKDQVTD